LGKELGELLAEVRMEVLQGVEEPGPGVSVHQEESMGDAPMAHLWTKHYVTMDNVPEVVGPWDRVSVTTPLVDCGHGPEGQSGIRGMLDDGEIGLIEMLMLDQRLEGIV
jgi:hypothetical protein